MAFLMWSREPWNWICCAFRPCTSCVLRLWVKQGELHPLLPCPSAKDRTSAHALLYKPPTEKWGCWTAQALIFLKTAFHSPLVSVWLTAIKKTMHLLGPCCWWLTRLHHPCSCTCAGHKNPPAGAVGYRAHGPSVCANNTWAPLLKVNSSVSQIW